METKTTKKRIPLAPLITLAVSLLWLGFYLLFRDNKVLMTAVCRDVV